MDDKLKKLILLMEIKNEEKFSSFTESIKQLDKQGFELMSDIKLLFDEISKVESSVDDTELKSQIESLKESIADIQLQKGDKGEDGKDGKNGLNGKDGKDGRDGIDGIDGLNGKDGEKGEDGSPDTAEDIVKKINTLESVIERKTIKGLDNLVDQPGLDRALGILDQRTQYLINKTVVQPNLAGYVPTTRTLTINGVTEDLSADRNWSVGTVTSVAALTLGTTGTDLSSTVATGTTTPVITLNVPTASASNRGALSSTDWSTFNSKESALTFSTGLTRSTNTITNNLSTGISGGQSVIGGTASGNNLTFSSTSNATKGKILFGTSAYDEVNNRLGIGTTTPAVAIEAAGSIRGNASGFAVKLVPDSTGSRIQFGITATADNSMMEIGGYNAKNNIDTKGRDLQIFSTIATTGLTFKQATGFIGINTTNPGSMLTVVGADKDQLRLGADTSYYYKIGRNVSDGLLDFQGNQSGFTGYDFKNESGTSRLYIKSDGDIGIGMTSPTALLHMKAGTATASTAPLKFTSGTNLTTAEAGAMEFTTDNLYFTITTGVARKKVTLDEGLTSGRVPFATTNGRLTDDADMTFATDTLTVTKIVGATSVKVGTAAGYISSDGSTGATGIFTTVDLKTVTVKDGIITSIV